MGFEFVKSERFWKYLLWVAVGVYFLTRVATLMAFPVFNDEAIYLQYTQAIHSDFSKYKFISEGVVYADWKPPLQYWIGSLFFGIVSDPLFAGRLASFVISLLGLGGVYLFVKELFGKKEATIAVLLYALCPTAIFFNNQYVAETFVFSLAPWMYWSFLRAIRSSKVNFWYLALAAIFGILVLLSKQSGMVYVGLALLLPIASLWDDGNEPTGHRWQRKVFSIHLGAVAAGVIAAMLLRRLGSSTQSAALEGQFNDRWLMSIQQLLGFPLAIWRNNFNQVRGYYYSYYSVFILLPLAYFFYLAAYRRQAKDIILGIGFLGGSISVILLLKSFNEYIYNTAVIVFLIPLLARALWVALESLAGGGRGFERWLQWLVLASFVLLTTHWTYQDGLMKISAAGYIRRSTPWAITNYLEDWPGGFGVSETLAYLRAQPGPGLILADPQWGNPRTTLEVYNPDYPRMRVVGLSKDMQTDAGTQAVKKFILTQPFQQRLVVFSSDTNETRIIWQRNVEKYLCDTRKEIQVEPTQQPIVICSF
jgi:Dolichyl-phosphate-mannose-protein mannosyltransferase